MPRAFRPIRRSSMKATRPNTPTHLSAARCAYASTWPTADGKLSISWASGDLHLQVSGFYSFTAEQQLACRDDLLSSAPRSNNSSIPRPICASDCWCYFQNVCWACRIVWCCWRQTAKERVALSPHHAGGSLRHRRRYSAGTPDEQTGHCGLSGDLLWKPFAASSAILSALAPSAFPVRTNWC